MIYSENPEPNAHVFNELLKASILELNFEASKSPEKIMLLTGDKLEPYVEEILSDKAIGTPFENTIIRKGGQKFPDIIANNFYGIEVKSTTQNHWKTTGNSVLESTRIGGVERIFMLFGKLGAPIEFRYRPYEECLSEVVVTHSPRYLIDMNLPSGATIFDKMNIPYDELRVKPKPITSVVEYYKSKLKKGEEIWWMSQESERANNVIIRIWNQLIPEEKNKIQVSAMVVFPEIFGSDKRKYDRIPAWLVTNHSVVCKNVRDVFTAGGKYVQIVNGKSYSSTPKIFHGMFKHLNLIVETIAETPASELSEYWGYITTEESKLSDWIKLVSSYSSKISDSKHLNFNKMINESLML